MKEEVHALKGEILLSQLIGTFRCFSLRAYRGFVLSCLSPLDNQFLGFSESLPAFMY